ncbi:MAG: hypothetical protein HC817_12105 [Saprospiraceae bacterium]|nr:hypothetical protein [Saprospiraceae bacterium]
MVDDIVAEIAEDKPKATDMSFSILEEEILESGEIELQPYALNFDFSDDSDMAVAENIETIFKEEKK